MNKKFIYFILILIILSSTVFKLIFMFSLNDLPLAGDAPGFINKAHEMLAFYDCSTREPAWILWTKFHTILKKNPKTSLRTSNIILLTGSTFLIFLIVLHFSSEVYALAAAAMHSFFPYLFFSPIRAHRLELYLFLLLLISYLTLRLKTKKYSAVILGIMQSILILVRSESMIVLPFFMIYRTYFIHKKLAIKETLIVLAILSTLAGPFFYSCYKEKGSPLYVLNTHAKFYASHEKAVINKTISVDKVLKSPYDIANMDLGKYLFGMHSVLNISKRVIFGYSSVLTTAAIHLLKVPIDLSWAIYPIWLGFLYLLFISQGRHLLFFGLLYILPHSFILSTRLGGHSSVDIRFAASAIPLLSFAMAGFVILITKTISKKLTAVSKQSTLYPRGHKWGINEK